MSDVYSKLSANYEIIIELENQHENTKRLIFERQEHLANEFESVQTKIFDLEKSMLEDMKHIIADLKEKQINNQLKIDEIEKMNLSKLGDLPSEVEKLGLKLRTIQANINGDFYGISSLIGCESQPVTAIWPKSKCKIVQILG